ncbi:acyl-CoA-binding domain-containing protein 5-B isoform X2 [Triplophysa rosa]|uniref:acyl-CoA-binding domain-containing protein 5-B isoform X2 n=1 Tax=Triplophysa rosa TaxID=992332 RepID=UPI002545FA6A|nr:acyl-CoA-binding domain-containing protein 5-B isoform X2 [Triplophysa rosa]
MIIETLPVTDRMEELMDALDPFYEIVEDEDEAARSKPAQLSTDLNILAAGDGGSLVFNGGEESSVSSSTNETHSSLNTEVEEEELVYSREPSTEPPKFCSSDNYPSGTGDIILTKYKSHTAESDDELYSDSMEQPEKPQKGSGVPRVRLADVSAAGANIKQRQGGNREAQCGSQDGKPQGVKPPVPHPPALGTVQTDRMSQSRGRGCRLVGTNLTEHSCQGDGEMKGSKDKHAFNTQIAMTLSQLQNNMRDVLQRLTKLEILTASQIESISLESCRTNSPNTRLPWWPLDLSPICVVLAVMWPFAVHWLVQVYLQKRKIWLKYNPVK